MEMMGGMDSILPWPAAQNHPSGKPIENPPSLDGVFAQYDWSSLTMQPQMTVELEQLLSDSLNVFSRIRDQFKASIRTCESIDREYAQFSRGQMHYYAERCQSLNILLQEWKLWDCDILMRSALECATRFLFVSVADQPERLSRIDEYSRQLNEIEDIQRSEKARTAARNAVDDEDRMLLGGAALDPTDERDLRLRWPKSKRQALKHKWAFSEIVRVLVATNVPNLDLRQYGSLLHSYGLSSHLIHADKTAMNLVADRFSREPDVRKLQEQAHFARLAVEQTSLFFVCWRALERITGTTGVARAIGEDLMTLYQNSNGYHHEFAESQRHLYANPQKS
jgi:hypothetical protein